MTAAPQTGSQEQRRRQERGLTAEYFWDENFRNRLTSPPESTIAHENMDELGGYPAGFQVRGRVRWSSDTAANGQFQLYEDENVNYNYEKGAFSVIPFRYDESSRTLTIGARQGESPGMLKERTFEIVWISKGKPGLLKLDAPGEQTVSYGGNKVVVKKLSN